MSAKAIIWLSFGINTAILIGIVWVLWHFISKLW